MRETWEGSNGRKKGIEKSYLDCDVDIPIFLTICTRARGRAGSRYPFLTQKERDVETGLDYFGARYYTSTQGRFTSTDPGPFTPADPQNFNRYSYVQNNPLKFIDPSGEELVLLGDDAEYVKAELERKTGYKLNRNEKTGVVTIDNSSKRKSGEEVSDSLAAKLEGVINLQDEQKNNVTVTLNTTRDEKGEIFVDDFKTRSLDVSDYKALNQADTKLGSTLLGHVLDEYQQAATTFKGLAEKEQFDNSHASAIVFESKVLSDYTMVSEKPRLEINLRGVSTVGFQYTSIQYDIQRKSASGASSQVIQNVRITQRRRP